MDDLENMNDEELIAKLRRGWEEVNCASEADCRRAAERIAALAAASPRPLSEYHEDYGPVVWWQFPVNEPAWIGKPDDDDWPGYHTHWTPHPTVPTP